MPLEVDRLADEEQRAWCARLMASNDPWITLKRDFDSCYAGLGDAAKERYLITDEGNRLGLLVLDMRGPLAGYIQSICVAAESRGRGVGSHVIAWAEERIFRDSPNVFICASSFNHAAQRLYLRLGYEPIGVLRNFMIDGLDEVLLRKSRGSWDQFRRIQNRPLRDG